MRYSSRRGPLWTVINKFYLHFCIVSRATKFKIMPLNSSLLFSSLFWAHFWARVIFSFQSHSNTITIIEWKKIKQNAFACAARDNCWNSDTFMSPSACIQMNVDLNCISRNQITKWIPAETRFHFDFFYCEWNLNTPDAHFLVYSRGPLWFSIHLFGHFNEVFLVFGRQTSSIID